MYLDLTVGCETLMPSEILIETHIRKNMLPFHARYRTIRRQRDKREPM